MPAASSPRSRLSDVEQEAMQRLLAVAKRDTGQSRKVANFLLAWWNAEACGGFDLADVWSVDRVITEDMLVILEMIGRVQSYPDILGYAEDFAELVALWRPTRKDEARVD